MASVSIQADRLAQACRSFRTKATRRLEAYRRLRIWRTLETAKRWRRVLFFLPGNWFPDTSEKAKAVEENDFSLYSPHYSLRYLVDRADYLHQLATLEETSGRVSVSSTDDLQIISLGRSLKKRLPKNWWNY